MFYHTLRNVILASVLLLAAGCGNYVGKEKSHPLFVKAASCRDSGNYEEAARYFREFLKVCPASPRVHYELATLCNDNLNDPFGAVYYYSRCLELGGMGKADNEAIRSNIELAKKKTFQLLSRKYESADTVRLREEALKLKKNYDLYVDYSSKLRKSLDKYISYTGSLKKQNAELRAMIEKLKNTPPPEEQNPPSSAEEKQEPNPSQAQASAETPVPEEKPDAPPMPENGWHKELRPVAASPSSTAASSVEPAQGKVTPQAGTKQYKVKPGDSLYRISKNLYGSSKYYQLILEANAKTIGKNGNRLRPGQLLVIPPLPAPGGKK